MRKKRSNEEWTKIFNTYESTQQDRTTWCEEHNIPESSYRDAHYRLFPGKPVINRAKKKFQWEKSAFKEL